MEIQRFANAGVLLRLDGVSILLDGLCDRIEPYMETPADMAQEIINNPPDLLAFTHGHSDHYSEALVSEYRKQNLRPILGPESLPYGTDHSAMRIGDVKIIPIPSRHLGKTDPNLQHMSYLIEGSRRIFFAGDAAPQQWKGREMPLDVLIAPYAYANTASTWQWSKNTAKSVVLVHLPEKSNDPAGLWEQVTKATGLPECLQIPDLGENVTL